MEQVAGEFNQDVPDTEPVRDVADETTGEVIAEATITPALASELVQIADQYAAAEQPEKAAEGVTPVVEPVFDGPYDFKDAMRQVIEVNQEVQAAEREYKYSKEQTANFKKIYDGKVETLTRLISRFDGRSRDADQPYLAPVTESDTNGETVDARRARLAEQLARKYCFVTADALTDLDRTALDSLDNWLLLAGDAFPPDVLAKKAHVAGPAGDDGSHCVTCGGRLGRRTDTEDFPERAFVGMDCPGAPVEEARPTAKRGAKKGRHKVDPESERTSQRTEGVKRAKSNKAKKAKVN